MTKPPANSGKPLAGYIRVSRLGDRDEERLRSPEWQEQAIGAKAKAIGRDVLMFKPEIDVTGSKLRRSVLDEILADIDSGNLGGLIVYNVSRLSRLKPADRIALFDRIEDAGGVVVSTAENLDPSTPEGRFQRELFLSLARMEWERHAEGWTHSKQAAHARGVRVGWTPFGYARDADSRLIPHEQHAPMVRQMFQIVARTRTFQAAVDYLNAQDVERVGKWALKRRERIFQVQDVRRMIRSEVYLGVDRIEGVGDKQDAHPALVSQREWDAAQIKTRRAPRTQSYPITGLPVCGSCGSHMVGKTNGDSQNRVRVYTCAAGMRQWRGERCPKPASVSADALERFVRDELARRAADVNLSRIESDPNLYEQLTDRIAKAEAELAAFILHTPATTPGYAEARAQRSEAIDALKVEAKAVAQRESSITVLRRGRDEIRNADDKTLGVILRAAIAEGLVLTVIRRPHGRTVPIAERAFITERDDHPDRAVAGPQLAA